MQRLPDTTVDRLPVYLRALERVCESGATVVSSEEIAKLCGTNAAQVRKDLSFLGELGTRGLGYDPRSLADHIAQALGLTKPRKVVIVGFGRLGGALSSYIGLIGRGFEVVAVVDSDPAKVGTVVGGLTVAPVGDLERVVRETGAEIAVVTTPPDVAQHVAEQICRAGIRAVLNFAPVQLELRCDVKVRQVDLSVGMQVLSYHLEHGVATA